MAVGVALVMPSSPVPPTDPLTDEEIDALLKVVSVYSLSWPTWAPSKETRTSIEAKLRGMRDRPTN